MLLWNDMHAYNAVHVVRIPAPLDMDRLLCAVNGTLEKKGLTGLTIDRERGTYRYAGVPLPSEIKVIAGETDPRLALTREIERQINTAFVQEPGMNPFRFFVVPEGDAFSFGLVYFHVIAGAESVVLLLQEMVNTFLGRREDGLSTPVQLYPRIPDNLIRHHPLVLVRKLATFPSLIRNLRSSCRPVYRDPQNHQTKLVLFSLGPEHLLSLREAASSWGVTLNDLFLALLLKSVSALTPDRAQAAKRRKISVGSIVNLRKDLDVDRRSTFGLFLGSFVVTHSAPRDINVHDLALDVCRQTTRIKRQRLYLGTSVELAVSRFMLSRTRPERRSRFYPKNYPLWGGVTNMNLNEVWEQPDEVGAIDYVRAVSTGPATPLVLSITTVREVVNIGLTYRPTVFSESQIEQLKHDLLEGPHPLCGQP